MCDRVLIVEKVNILPPLTKHTSAPLLCHCVLMLFLIRSISIQLQNILQAESQCKPFQFVHFFAIWQFAL